MNCKVLSLDIAGYILRLIEKLRLKYCMNIVNRYMYNYYILDGWTGIKYNVT